MKITFNVGKYQRCRRYKKSWLNMVEMASKQSIITKFLIHMPEISHDFSFTPRHGETDIPFEFVKTQVENICKMLDDK